MKRHGALIVLLALATAVMLAGCWGSSKSTSVTVGGGGGTAATATNVGIDVCHNCHSATAQNGVGIFDAWKTGRHGNDNNSPAYSLSSSCAACHDPQGDGILLTNISGFTSTRPVIGCEACHGGGSEHYGVGPIGGPTAGYYAVAATTGQSSQYNTCTGCHQDSSPYHSTESWNYITDTHFDNGARAVNTTIQGYVIRKALNTACTDCHNPHSAGLTENLQWAASAHGEFGGEGWKHYDWKLSSRRDCQRCHTTTGFVNYVTDQSTYNAANNVFVATDNQAEMLYCYGCHQLGSGGFLVARRAVDNAYLPSGPGVNNTTTITGLGSSELCINCHSGREPGSQVKANLAASPTGPDNTSFGSFNSHYLLAGATLFQDNTFSVSDNQFIGPGAYQFVGNNYANPTAFTHNTIGGSTQGPCVGCHMTSPNVTGNNATGKHSFLPFTYTSGAVDNITSTQCASCHGVTTSALSVVGINASRTTYATRVAELKTDLESRGIYYNSASYPYFYSDNTWASSKQFKTWATKAGTLGISTEDLVGVAFNLNYFTHEPGAYAHNDVYTYRVLYDSIIKIGVTPSFGRP
jgi:hypothetical protein